jgi:hypothetical protein
MAVLFDPEEKNQYAGLKVQSLLEIETVIHTLSNISTQLFSNKLPQKGEFHGHHETTKAAQW